MRNARLATLTALGAAALALSGCAGATPGEGGGRISVVAVTDAYGSIAEAIGGDLVDVASIISGSAQDPHEYEATARDQLAVNRADLVIVNGGGYDDFLTRLLESSDAAVVNASEASGLLPADAEAHEHDEHDDHADGDAEDHAADDHDGHAHIAGFNEHVWYSIHGVAGIAEAIAAELTALAPDGADAIAQRADAFLAELDALHDRAHALEHELGGGDIMSTEHVIARLRAGAAI